MVGRERAEAGWLPGAAPRVRSADGLLGRHVDERSGDVAVLVVRVVVVRIDDHAQSVARERMAPVAGGCQRTRNPRDLLLGVGVAEALLPDLAAGPVGADSRLPIVYGSEQVFLRERQVHGALRRGRALPVGRSA